MFYRNQVAAAFVTIGVLLPLTLASAKQTILVHRPNVQLVKVGAYPTQVVATVRSVRVLKVPFSSETGSQTLCLLKLRIHTSKPLTQQGTTINDNESMEVVSAEPIDESIVGKIVKAQLEMTGDSDRERWFVTEVVSTR